MKSVRELQNEARAVNIRKRRRRQLAEIPQPEVEHQSQDVSRNQEAEPQQTQCVKFQTGMSRKGGTTHKNNLIPVGCPAHVLHNAAKRGADSLPFDIETIVFKLTSHFKSSTKRVEQLKNICDEFEASFLALTSHGPTRWTTLSRIVDKIMKLWEIFQHYFNEDRPLILRNFFNSDTAKVVLYFLSHILPIFNQSIDVFQRSNAILPELLDEMNKFRFKIKERQTKQFYGIMIGQLLRKLGLNEANDLKVNFQNFLQTTIDYSDKWFRLERFPKSVSWIGLIEEEVRHQDVIELASEIAPELEDKLFDEVTDLNRILAGMKDFGEMSSEEKWKRIFKAQLPNLYVLVSKVLAIPVSNAFVERVFSLCGAQWTDKRNSLEVETVKSLVQVKVNFDKTCPEMYHFLISKPNLLKKIVDGALQRLEANLVDGPVDENDGEQADQTDDDGHNLQFDDAIESGQVFVDQLSAEHDSIRLNLDHSYF